MTTTYSTILSDPPWPEKGGGGRGAQDHYDVIDRPAILRAMVSAPCWRPAADCHHWMWTTMSSLLDGLWLLDALGFRYITHAVWVKTTSTLTLDGTPSPAIGIGQYLRGAHELLLLGTRGKGFAVRTEAMNIPSWFMAPPPRGEGGERIHSRKPDKSYEMIEARSHGPYLEMFARARRSEKWDVWGNQAPSAPSEVA